MMCFVEMCFIWGSNVDGNDEKELYFVLRIWILSGDK